jgi:hypothetical protein
VAIDVANKQVIKATKYTSTIQYGNIQRPRMYIKGKESRNRPGVAQWVPGVLGSQISHSPREGGEVSLMHRPPLPPGMFPVLIFTTGRVDPRAMVRSEGDMSLKNPVTSPGIDPGTVRLVVHRLNHYATQAPKDVYIYIYTVDPRKSNIIRSKRRCDFQFVRLSS